MRCGNEAHEVPAQVSFPGDRVLTHGPRGSKLELRLIGPCIPRMALGRVSGIMSRSPRCILGEADPGIRK